MGVRVGPAGRHQPVRLPARPDAGADPTPPHDCESPYGRVASELRAQIASGELPVGSALATHKQLSEQHGISAGTAHRVTALLSSEGLIDVSRGRCATVIRQPLVDAYHDSRAADAATRGDGIPTEVATERSPAGALADGRRQQDDSNEIAMVTPELWVITVRGPDGRRYPARHVCESINRPDSFRAHLLAIARIEQPMDTDRGESWIGDYELEIREPGKEHDDPKFTLRRQAN